MGPLPDPTIPLSEALDQAHAAPDVLISLSSPELWLLAYCILGLAFVFIAVNWPSMKTIGPTIVFWIVPAALLLDPVDPEVDKLTEPLMQYEAKLSGVPHNYREIPLRYEILRAKQFAERHLLEYGDVTVLPTVGNSSDIPIIEVQEQD